MNFSQQFLQQRRSGGKNHLFIGGAWVFTLWSGSHSLLFSFSPTSSPITVAVSKDTAREGVWRREKDREAQNHGLGASGQGAASPRSLLLPGRLLPTPTDARWTRCSLPRLLAFPLLLLPSLDALPPH